MTRLTAVVLGVGLGLAFDASAAEEAEEAAAAARAIVVERPRGVCNVSQPGLSMVVEDTTAEACHERRLQCERDNPGHEAECRARWTASEDKVNRGKKAKAAGKAERAAR